MVLSKMNNHERWGKQTYESHFKYMITINCVGWLTANNVLLFEAPTYPGLVVLQGLPKVRPWAQFFLVYVNDISSNISSTLRIFADDTDVNRELSNLARDSEAPQFDVDQLLSWASKWQLRFNPDKCEVLRVAHKRDLFPATYSLVK